MEYKKMRDESILEKTKHSRLLYISVILACIVVVQCVTVIVMLTFNSKYKKLYDEALETQIMMQETINDLSRTTDINDNE